MGLLARTMSGHGRMPPGSPFKVPFAGGWIGWISYDLGRTIEPAAQAPDGAAARACDDRGWPLFELMRCDGAYVHDGEHGEWHTVGDESALPEAEALTNKSSLAVPRIEGFTSRSGRAAYEASVARAIELIRAGDIFQANLAHRLSAEFHGSPRLIAERLLSAAGAWYGAYIESPDDQGGIRRAIASASPELFLTIDAVSRHVVTRPIKGTRAIGSEAALLASEKDAAELAMIVDLMRNDLGRVCEYGSVRVDDPRSLETHGSAERESPEMHGDTRKRLENVSDHSVNESSPRLRVSVVDPPGVVHGVATVSGTLRPGFGAADLLRATFPPGSVTGAPKIRAMRVIDQLEPVRRGAYCGAVGFVSDCGHSAWNVAIRTAVLSCAPGGTAASARGTIDYSVGAGIVEGSNPATEWEETLHKAGILARAFPGCLDEVLNRDRQGAGAR